MEDINIIIEGLLTALAVILSIFIVIKIFFLPISIANGKNLTNNERSTIQIFTWCGLCAGITWFIALFLAINYDDNRPAY